MSSAAIRMKTGIATVVRPRTPFQVATRPSLGRLSRSLQPSKGTETDMASTSANSKPVSERNSNDITSDVSAPSSEPAKLITTWQYGKTVSDKDLPAWYIALIIVPFFAIIALPFLPQ
ncbi:hypothetical protein CEUSTIGMA_g4659.t1 [Chlamydomonas eustigma]|uniref:Uncharacterized protein n=1 Tax=Chlamydomonas eustigma TaxID=1157962 RepID=A0A250X295_9CHLO|nr:hypothetical protein CEUSTIGMA_g4659.t1 [Chlamydomonas eustigma]|eukprot:GAX77213.1 hypothetical protein CEUSTIGMA_g4659.t1 [Chlamydomonas eustigma]